MMMRSHRYLFSILVCLLFTISLMGQSIDFDDVKKQFDQNNVRYFVTKVTGRSNEFVGINYLRNVSLIAIHAEVLDDNVSFVEESITAKDFKKAYLDLSLMKGNSYTIVFDFMVDGLERSGDSGDFIKLNDKVCYLNKTAEECGFASAEELEQFFREFQTRYKDWVTLIITALAK